MLHFRLVFFHWQLLMIGHHLDFPPSDHLFLCKIKQIIKMQKIYSSHTPDNNIKLNNEIIGNSTLYASAK